MYATRVREAEKPPVKTFRVIVAGFLLVQGVL